MNAKFLHPENPAIGHQKIKRKKKFKTSIMSVADAIPRRKIVQRDEHCLAVFEQITVVHAIDSVFFTHRNVGHLNALGEIKSC